LVFSSQASTDNVGTFSLTGVSAVWWFFLENGWVCN
jgi:hypothetical protein